MFWRHANNLGGYVKTFGEKKNKHFLGGNIFYLPISWVYAFFRQIFGLTSGAFVRDMVDLILMRKGFNYFNFYSIDLQLDLIYIAVALSFVFWLK